MDDTRLLVLGQDQWVKLTLNDWGAAPATPIALLSTATGNLYEGDIEYDPSTGRVYHLDSGISPPAVASYQLAGSTLQLLLSTGASGGLPLTLSTDGTYLDLGRLEVSTANLKTTVFNFPYSILANTAGIAFSNSNNIYAAATGEAIGTLGYSASTMLASDDGLHLLAFDTSGGNKVLHFYRVTPLGWGVLANDTDQEDDRLTAALVAPPSHGTLHLNADGTFDYTPQAGYNGPDSFTY